MSTSLGCKAELNFGLISGEAGSLIDCFAAIRAILLDVDGVLTDGGVWWGPNGEEWKRFSFADIMGVSLARKAGLTVGLISGEESPLVGRFALKMNLTDTVTGCKDKAGAVRSFAELRGLALQEICFMGDDVNDLEAMRIVGVSAAPASAVPVALQCASFVSIRNGGNGAVRELVDAILQAQSKS
jgi:3-deoxy-D-manno-octulosonate 8-phosphate phosphatase (KDO 8-P phosphatase)